MLNWVKINNHDDIPSGRDENGRIRYFLAIHSSDRYVSDVYMIWKDNDGTLNRWREGTHTFPITHIAEYNLPERVSLASFNSKGYKEKPLIN